MGKNKLKFWVVSCSCGGTAPLILWDTPYAVHGYKSEREAKAVLSGCKLNRCYKGCDAQIHKVIIERKP